VRKALLFRIACDPPARLWGGVGNLDIPADAVEPDDEARYLGGGELLDIPDIEQLINGTAQRLDVTVSGVNAETVRLAVEEAASVKGAAIDIGNVYHGDDWQLASVEWIATLRADTLTVASQSSERGRTRSITLSIGTDFTDRSHAPIAFFSDADQNRLSPGDAIFDHVAGNTAGMSRSFAPKT
jgi:hypothetical protein